MLDIFRFLKLARHSKCRTSKPRRHALGTSPYHRRLHCEALEVRTLLSVGLAGIQSAAAQPQTMADLPADAQAAVAAALHSDLATVQTAKLTPSDSKAGDGFGGSVAVSGNTLVVGDSAAEAAYVFTNTSGSWTQVAKLTAASDTGGWGFGGYVAISGNTIVVGAAQADSYRGAAFVFVEPTSGWANMSQPAMLTSNESLQVCSYFGCQVAIDGNTIAVGAGEGGNAGGVYVFSEPIGGWTSMTPTATLTATNAWAFGCSVAISGNTIVAGAVFGPFSQESAAYVFAEPASGWTNMTQTGRLTPTDALASGDDFGLSVAIDGDTAVVGAYGNGQGKAYVYTEPASGWGNMSQTAELTSTDGYWFGCSIAIKGNTIVIGGCATTVSGNSDQGADYVFAEPSGGWADMTQTAKLVASDGAANDYFGESTAFDGGTLLIGAPATAAADVPGAAYVFALGPAVSSVSSTTATGTYLAGTMIPITVTFNEPMTVTGTPQLALNAGSGAIATYASGSGTAALTFDYTVGLGDSTSDLDYTSTSALTLNGGTIDDTAGDAANLTLPATGTDGLAAQNIVVAVMDGFESGDFSALPWQLSSMNTATAWSVESSSVHSGKYAAESGAIGGVNKTTGTALSVTLTTGAGELSFWRETSSATGTGSLIFSIDETPQMQLSGTMPWQQSFFWVPAGQHTFTWLYAKNASDPAGNDFACLDDVEFVSTTTLIVDGATSSDQFTVDASGATASGGPIVVALNGEVHSFTAAEFSSYVYQGTGGTAVLIGSASGNSAVLHANGSGQLTNSTAGYTVTVSGTLTVDAFGHAGDTAQLYDSSGDDVFFAYADYNQGGPVAGVYGTGHSDTASGFGTNAGTSVGGGGDIAVFFDSPGNDTFSAYADYQQSGKPYASMTGNYGSGFSNSATGFVTNVALSTAGGSDTAQFYDSPGVDTFYAYADYAGRGQSLAGMYGSGYSNSATGFSANQGNSTNGGNDEAVLFGSPQTNTFSAYGNYNQGGHTFASMSGSGYDNTATGFGTMIGVSGSAADTANLYDAAGSNTLCTTQATACLWGSGNYGELASGFSAVNASGALGSKNTMAQGAVGFQLNYVGNWVPGGYSIAADQTVIGPSQATATGFTFADAVTGATYSYVITSSGGSGSVTGTGTVTSATEDVTGINVSSLPAGTLTFSVTLTNSIGQAGAAATATATLDAA